MATAKEKKLDPETVKACIEAVKGVGAANGWEQRASEKAVAALEELLKG